MSGGSPLAAPISRPATSPSATGTRHARASRTRGASSVPSSVGDATVGAVDTDPRTTSAGDPALAGRIPPAVWVTGGLLAFLLAAVVLVVAGSLAMGVPPVTPDGTRIQDSALTGSGRVIGPGPDPDVGAAAGADGSAVTGPMQTADPGFAVWAVNDDGQPVRWDPCRPIEVVLSLDGAPASARADLDGALERLIEASGLDLVRTGTTDERPTAARPPYQPERYGERWAPILVAWAAPGEAGLPLRDTDRGVAIPIAGGPAGDRTFLTAQVVLNRDRTDLLAGFSDRADAWGATILHELLHALGLDHVDDPEQLMAVYPGSGPVVLRDGDLAGLAAIGPTHGCRPLPPPGPLTVAPAP